MRPRLGMRSLLQLKSANRPATTTPRNQSAFQKPDCMPRASPCCPAKKFYVTPLGEARRQPPLKQQPEAHCCSRTSAASNVYGAFESSHAEQRTGLYLAGGKKLAGCDFFPFSELRAQHLDAAALRRDLEALVRNFNHFADLSLHRTAGAHRVLACIEDL